MTSKYQPVKHADDEKFEDVFPPRRTSISGSESTLLEDEEDARATRPKKGLNERWMWLAHAALLMLSFTMFVSSWFARISTLEYVQQFSAYSPAAKAVVYERVKYNNTMGIGSPFVGKGPEVDLAWQEISYDIGDQMITPEELEILDMPKSSLKVKHPVTGVEGYRVGLEAFHLLHCVNLLRQVTYKEYYTDEGNVNFDNALDLQVHTDHCLEILRLHVQCNADVGLFTFYMLPGDPLPWPELDSWHQCRNFDAVRDWAMENSVGNMERPDIPDIHPDNV